LIKNDFIVYLDYITAKYKFILFYRYTSLGNKSKSHPNPNLKYTDESTVVVKYCPAFLLQDSNSERENRL